MACKASRALPPATSMEDALDKDRTDEAPVPTEDLGLPTPPSPGRLPPIDLPPASKANEADPGDDDAGPSEKV